MDKIIQIFDLDLSNISSGGEVRSFTITGDDNAEFYLEVKDSTTGYYYNFFNNSFQAANYKLERNISGGSYNGNITFPPITASSNYYDVYLYARFGTKHAVYDEVRFADGTLDINSSTGSSSLLLQKIIYQYQDIVLTLQGYSPNSTVVGTFTTDTTSVVRNGNVNSKLFTLTATAKANTSYAIKKQLEKSDILAFTTSTIANSSPEALPGEDIYPTVTSTDTVDGNFAAGTATKLVLDTDVVGNITVGDKITIASADLTDTVDGAVESGVKVVMDNNVATKMAVGDRVTGSLSGITYAQLDASIITVAALNPDGDNVKEFSLSEAVALDDAAVLTFTPKCNRETFTVAALNPDEDNAKEFSYVDSAGGTTSRLGLKDGAALSFSNQKNQQWLLDDISGIGKNVSITGTNIEGSPVTSDYQRTITISEGTENENIITTDFASFVDTKGEKPTVSEGLVTAQPGFIIFDQAQPLSVKNVTITTTGYGERSILSLYKYNVVFSDLLLTLTPTTTTTTSAVTSSTTIPVASVNGFLPGTTTVGGIGIDPNVVNPTVISRSVTSGAGNIELNVAQTLESGVTLKLGGSSQLVTITGKINIVQAGTADQTIYFDLEKLLLTT